MSDSVVSSRRQFLKLGAAGAAGAMVPEWRLAAGAPPIVVSQSERPQALQGLTFADSGNGSVVVWSRSDRAARMIVEWSYDEQFKELRRLTGPHALDTTDFTARQSLTHLEAGSDVFVRVSFESLKNDRAVSEPVTGRFVVPPDSLREDGHRFGRFDRDLRFVWSGDTAGQGWGINPNTEKNVPLLIARGTRAFLDYGPLLDLFVLDMRSYRGGNSANLQTAPSAQTVFLGREQLEWLKAGLDDSRAVWKVVAREILLIRSATSSR
jgi:phosphodiesterase/alkaline phosphatase D-like protein